MLLQVVAGTWQNTHDYNFTNFLEIHEFMNKKAAMVWVFKLKQRQHKFHSKYSTDFEFLL